MTISMRYMELAKAAKLTTAIFTWDKSYSYILERETYEDGVLGDVKTDFTTTRNTPTVTTVEYILPRFFSSIIRLDGVSWGNMKLSERYVVTGCPGTVDPTVFLNMVITFKARTSGGIDRTLATYTPPTIQKSWGSVGNGNAEYTEEIPLRITFNNQKLLATERLIMSIAYSCSYTITDDSYTTLTCAQYHTINSNELFIELPIVGS